jgi:hypothetical protein
LVLSAAKPNRDGRKYPLAPDQCMLDFQYSRYGLRMHPAT